MPATLELLRSHPWPGNIRELRNVMERAAVLSGGASIAPEHLSAELPATHRHPPAPVASVATAPAAGRVALTTEEEAERARIAEALERAAGNQTHAANLLGISRGTLLSRLDRYGLPRPRLGRSRS